MTVSATHNSGYAFTGFSGSLSGATNPQNLTMNGTKSVTANFTPQQYYLTTSVSPAGGGTISPASGWYNSGTVVTVSATHNSGYAFTGFTGALSGTNTPQYLTMSGSASVVANFTTTSSPPAVWKGITYSPRGHSYFRMLYDWYGYNLASTVDQDLTRLSQAGYNLLHLYIWDKQLLRTACFEPSCNPSLGEPAGFLSGPDGQPEYSDHNQWQALNDFVSIAESKNLYVAIHFANGWLLNDAGSEARASEFVGWATRFINHLTPQHRNVLLWGMAYAYWPGHGTFQTIYNGLDTAARNTSPLPGSLGLIGVNLTFGIVPDNSVIQPRLTGYSWSWSAARSEVQSIRSRLGRDADVYMVQPYHANSADLKQNLCLFMNGTGLSGGVCPNPDISPSRVFAVEFATSSSVQSGASVGGIPFSNFGWGDNNTPATTPAGQAQWTTNTLCVFESLGIKKSAYWAMYDPITMWTSAPWKRVGADLGWNGFWGLAHESAALGDKPAWSVMANYNPFSGTGLNCQSPAVPVLSITPSTDYYTPSQPVRVTWTATDVTALSVNGGQGESRMCTPHPIRKTFDPLSATAFLGSCAFGDAPHFLIPGTQPVTLTSTPYQTATVNVDVGLAPVVTAVVDQDYGASIQPFDTIVVLGKGFSLAHTSTLRFTRAGYTEVWCFNGDGHYFWNESHNQINASLDGRLAAGTWQLEVRNGYSGTPSATIPVVIQ